ncbi:MAG: Ntn hydrolase family protein [Candidatus Humimicrobiaceae bacterium]
MNNKNIRYNHINKEEEKYFMTTILGLYCSDGIVIASDSQATLGTVKRSQEDKITYIKINNYIDVVVAGSGTEAYISRFTDLFDENKTQKEINLPRDFADLCEDVIRVLVQRYPDLDIGLITGIKISNNCFGLYSLYPIGVAEKINNYSCFGSGSTIAEYILARLYYPGISIEKAIKIAIYVIEEVKKVDTYSGGFIRVTFVNTTGVYAMNLIDIINESSKIQKSDFELKNIWTKIILNPEEIIEKK